MTVFVSQKYILLATTYLTTTLMLSSSELRVVLEPRVLRSRLPARLLPLQSKKKTLIIILVTLNMPHGRINDILIDLIGWHLGD